ncbi:MAG: hypothetical protein PHV30_11385 [Candidatus Margulisbacteria bacterium]|nr:hypothetical protein [Candidatus Margulisiibacteriota bacterium]
MNLKIIAFSAIMLDQYILNKYSVGPPVTSSIKTAVATLNHHIKQLRFQYLNDSSGMFEAVVRNLFVNGAYFGNGFFLLSNRFPMDIYHKELKKGFLEFLAAHKSTYNPTFGYFIITTFKPTMAGYKISEKLWLQGIGGENQFNYRSLHLGMLRKELINELEIKFAVKKNSIFNLLKSINIVDKNGLLLLTNGFAEFPGCLLSIKENLPAKVLKQTDLMEQLEDLLFNVYRGFKLRCEIIASLKNDLAKP